ncbi:MAG: hypothetical protein J6N72_08925 [Psychrobacter sp.]|nr:hypothetical protein [Psychrobacter sp.]
MSIKTTLTHSEFITLYGESQFVRSYTYDAKIGILEHIESIQDEYEGDLDWTEIFMEAAEYTPSDMIAHNNNFNIDQYVDELIDAANNILFDGIIEKELENDDGLSNDELWKSLKSHLLGNAEFEIAAAEILGKEHGLTELDNGNWLKL